MEYALIGYACDLGGVHLGAAKGPRILRDRGLAKSLKALGLSCHDYGDAKAATSPSAHKTNSQHTLEDKMRNCPDVYSACSALYEKTAKALQANHFPIILGGDHSSVIGSFAAISDHYAAKNEKVGLIYIDAHPDIHNFETSLSKCLFGATISILSADAKGMLSSLQKNGKSLDYKNLSFIGLRDVDSSEKSAIKKNQINAFSIKEVDRYGMASCIEKAIEIASKDTAGFFVSFDIDACDPALVPGTQSPIRGGLTFRESHLAIEMLYDSGKMLGFELAEFNPDFDQDNKTSDFCISLIESAVGKSIL